MIYFGMDACPDCVKAKESLAKAGIRYINKDISQTTAAMKQFLKLRDSREEFQEIKATGKIGIPCFLLKDDSFCFDVEEILRKEKKLIESFADLKSYVKEHGFGSSQFNNINGDVVYISKGIQKALLHDFVTTQLITDIVMQFQKQNYGNADEFGKTSVSGHEYGRYDCSTFDQSVESEDIGVWVHRTEDALKVYFSFER